MRATIDHYLQGEPDYTGVRPYVEAVLKHKGVKFTYDTNRDAEQVWKIARTAMQDHGNKQRGKLKTLDGQISQAMARQAA